MVRAGPALLANGSWAVVLVPAATAIRARVIEREERYVEPSIGEEYVRYKAGVRRWV